MRYLSGSSPYIKSGAVAALSILVYNDPEICFPVPDLLSSVICLLQNETMGKEIQRILKKSQMQRNIGGRHSEFQWAGTFLRGRKFAGVILKFA